MIHGGNYLLDRTSSSTADVIVEIWKDLGLPADALNQLHLGAAEAEYVSSFKIADLAQASIALSALSAALVESLRQSKTQSTATIDRYRAILQFHTERLYTIEGRYPDSVWGPIGGLHATVDGFVKVHDGFPHHRDGALQLLGLSPGATREEVSHKIRQYTRLDLENRAHIEKLPIYALRTYHEWDSTEQARAISNHPIILRKINDQGPKGLSEHMCCPRDKHPLRGLRMLELSRVIAAPVAGMTIASHGADVLWITSPNLPDLPPLDRVLSRGKRTIQLDLNVEEDSTRLRDLIRESDVFLQGYAPRSLAQRGFSAAELAALRPGIIYANLSAFGPDGPWSDRRGFDSLVQTCSGMNASEAEHYGSDEPARPLPCQALDHAAGYFLAAGISAAVYRRAIEGGTWEVHVSLAAVGKYLRSLGQLPGDTGFQHEVAWNDMADIADDYFEETQSGFGRLRALKLAPVVDGAMPAFDHMPKPLGSDEARWL